MPRRSIVDRLAGKFVLGDGCWPWIAGRDKDGYGTFYGYREDGQPTGLRAHRVVYELLVGPIPEGLELDHVCKNTSCVRPSHLEPVTHLENVRRGNPGRPRKARCKYGHDLTDPANIRMWHGQRKGCLLCRSMPKETRGDPVSR